MYVCMYLESKQASERAIKQARKQASKKERIARAIKSKSNLMWKIFIYSLDAVVQNFSHKAHFGSEAEAEQADPAVDSIAYRQHDPVE